MSAHQQYPPLKYGSVCSGIEAATVAWHPLGMRPVWFAEIETFPSAVLAHHYPDTPNLGDMTKLAALVLSGKIAAPDVLVGGTPCQAFSVAGMRQGMLDPRGALTIKYVELADAVDHVRTSRNEPESIIVWENVPGVLSDRGNAFGCFLGALAGEDCELQPPGKRWQDAGCVYGPKRTIAWRILDAQYFGLAQRRRRVFVVASAREGFDPAQVLFEREGVRRDTAPSREAGQSITHPIAPCLTSSGRGVERGGDTREQDPVVAVQLVVGTQQANGKAAGSCTPQDAEPDMLVVHGTQDPCVSDIAFALGRNSGQENAVAFTQNSRSEVRLINGDGLIVGALAAEAGAQQQNYIAEAYTVSLRGRDGGATAELGESVAGCLRASSGGGDKAHVLHKSAVRRLTPRECERLQGFPDDYTMIARGKKAAEDCTDGPRYKAIGNSKAVPVVRWIGMRVLEQL